MTKIIFRDAGALYLQPRGIWIIKLQVPTELKPQYIYELCTSDDLPSGFIPITIDRKINHKYPKLLNIPILNMVTTVYKPKSMVFRALKPVRIESAEISQTSWIKSRIQTRYHENLVEYVNPHKITMNSLLHHHSQVFNLNKVITIDNP